MITTEFSVRGYYLRGKMLTAKAIKREWSVAHLAPSLALSQPLHHLWGGS
jgi:hypothetical protein